MKSLQSMKKSIDSTTNLHSIVNTMKAHASTNIIQFQRSALASRQYRVVLDMALHVVLSHEAEKILDKERVEGDTIHVVFGSDHGLCGSFNERIAFYAQNSIPKDEKNIILAVGRQALTRLSVTHTIAKCFTVPSTDEGITPTVQRLLFEIDHIKGERKVSRILLHYNKPVKGAVFEEETEILFPIDLREIAKDTHEWSSNTIPTYYMDSERLMSDLLKQYFFITLFRTFCFSLVAENESRIASMTSAAKNIEERLDDLQMLYKRMRQGSITDEIRDISSGFIALKKAKEEEKKHRL